MGIIVLAEEHWNFTVFQHGADWAPLAGQIPPLLATSNSPTPDRMMAL